MNGMSFAAELREKYNLSLELANSREQSLINFQIEKLKEYMEMCASIGKMTFSIHFRKVMTNDYKHYPPPPNAMVLDPMYKKSISTFLTNEEFYFDEWSQHIYVDLLKEAKK